jgi:hypothetical protein
MPDRKHPRRRTTVVPSTIRDFIERWYAGERFSPNVYDAFGFIDELDVTDELGKEPMVDGPAGYSLAEDIVEERLYGYGGYSERTLNPSQVNGPPQVNDPSFVPSYYNRYPYSSPYDYWGKFKETPEQAKARKEREAEYAREFQAREEQRKREQAAGYYKPEEVESFLQDIHYDELPQDVREFFEKEFAQQIQADPGLMDTVRATKIDFKLKGPQGQTAEHFREDNRIEWYGYWKWESNYISKLYSPEEIRKKFVDKYLNLTMVHELTHVVQDYFNGAQEGIAQYPDEEHPEYREFGDVYKNDPGEQHARGVADKFVKHVQKPGGRTTFNSLHGWRKVLSWDIVPTYHHKETDTSGNTYYYNEKNKRHCEDGPAMEWANGTKYWYVNDKLHLTDGPAYERADGTKHWFVNDKLHREDGPAIEGADGSKEWWVNGNLHREDGPAIERANGSKYWYVNGKCHRLDGPAVESADGSKAWWVNGRKLTEAEFNRSFPHVAQASQRAHFSGMWDIVPDDPWVGWLVYDPDSSECAWGVIVAFTDGKKLWASWGASEEAALENYEYLKNHPAAANSRRQGGRLYFGEPAGVEQSRFIETPPFVAAVG